MASFLENLKPQQPHNRLLTSRNCQDNLIHVNYDLILTEIQL